MLYVTATPIGNSQDVTLRALEVLKRVAWVLAEDTRKTGSWLKRMGVEAKLISLYEHNEDKRIPWALEQLAQGEEIALVSSAGTPTINDPGFRLVRQARERSLPICCLPGPSSPVAALSVISLPHDKFTFLGFLPRKSTARKKAIMAFQGTGACLVFFESPYRLLKSLADIGSCLPGVRVSVVRELTKKFEDVREGAVEDIAAHYSVHSPRGECIIIIEAF